MEEAIAALDASLALQPDFPEAHNNRALALQLSGKLEEAAEAFREATRHKPEFVQVWRFGLLDAARLDKV